MQVKLKISFLCFSLLDSYWYCTSNVVHGILFYSTISCAQRKIHFFIMINLSILCLHQKILVGFPLIDNLLKLSIPSILASDRAGSPREVSAGSDLEQLRKCDAGESEHDGKQKRLKDTIKYMFLSSYTYVGRKIGVVCYHFNTIIWVPIFNSIFEHHTRDI